MSMMLVLTLFSTQALAVQIQDMVRLKGAESSKLHGWGLVIGLNGTGDGGKSQATQRALAALVARLHPDEKISPIDFKDAKNVAVVHLSATTPSGGVSEGDLIDVRVSAPMASSLKGGRLVLAAMLGPIPRKTDNIFAWATGTIAIEDANTPTVGLVKKGATMIKKITAQYMDDAGNMTLVVKKEKATWPTTQKIATLINDIMAADAPPIAFATTQQTVVIKMPKLDQANPGNFISQVMEIQIDPTLLRGTAKVVVNRKRQTIVITGNVEISPSLISQRGLTITLTTPPVKPTAQQPVTKTQNFLALDPGNRGGAKLKDLLDAFNRLEVPAEDRITILETLYKAGQLHAKLEYVDE